MSTQEIPSQADFRERAKTNDVPIARLIGFGAKDIADGRATVVLAARPQHTNPMGTLHGGILCDIADAAMGIAFYEDGEGSDLLLDYWVNEETRKAFQFHFGVRVRGS